MTTPEDLHDLEADVAACLGRSAVDMRVAPAGGAGHVAYEVRDAPDADDPIAFYRSESGFAGRRYGLRREAEVLPVAAALGWPVPQVLGTPGDPPGLLMNLVPGTSRPDPEETEATAAEYLALVAGVHAADPASFPIGSSPPWATRCATSSPGGRRMPTSVACRRNRSCGSQRASSQ